MGVERVSDVDDPRLADYRDLKDGARRRRDGTFIAESRQVVRRLLGGSRFRARSVLAAEAAVEDLRDVLTGGLPVYVAPEATLQRVVGFNIHRGCLAVGERGAELALDGLLDARVLLVLEGVTNPDNIGGAFRNAMAFGVGGVVLAPRCSDPLYRKAIRVSMGRTPAAASARTRLSTSFAGRPAISFGCSAVCFSTSAESRPTFWQRASKLAMTSFACAASPGAKKFQMSACRATSGRTTFGPIPPIRIGGCGRCTGFGSHGASFSW